MKNLFTILLAIAALPVAAQPKQPVKQPVKPPVQNTAAGPLKITASFGPWASNSKVLVADIKRLVTSEVKAKDQKGNVYTVLSFNFTWMRKDTVDDYKTSKRRIVINPAATLVQGNRMPDEWVTELKAYLVSGEGLSLDRIIVQDPKTKKNYLAAELKLAVL